MFVIPFFINKPVLQIVSYHSDNPLLFGSSLYFFILFYHLNSVCVSGSDIKQTVLVSVVVLFDSSTFKAKFDFDDFSVDTEAVPTAKESWRECSSRCHEEILYLKNLSF